jgi:hypothetical protein
MMDLKVDTLPGTDREYELACTVEIIHSSYFEIADGKRHEAKTVILKPRLEPTDASRFLATYLPEVGTYCLKCHEADLRFDQIKCPGCGSDQIKTEWTEVVGWIGHPVHSPSRLALLRKNNYCSQHHLFVMGSGAESDLLDHDGKEIHVRIFKALDDHEADMAKSVNKTVDSKYNHI